jgi:hypothetical protein
MQGRDTLQHGYRPESNDGGVEIRAESKPSEEANPKMPIRGILQSTQVSTYHEITTTNPNKAHGHNIENLPNDNTLRIYHQNIRGAKTYQQWNTWKEGIQQLQTWKVGVATLVETNTKWNQININAATLTAKGITKQVKLNISGSTELTESDFQPGGTACVALSKVTGRITTKIHDKSGMGRWSGFEIQGMNQKTLITLSAYQPTASSDNSDRTCHSQQWRIMRSKNIENPKPRNQFIQDLTEQIKEWQEKQFEIIIGIDANEGMYTSNSKIAKLLTTTNLEMLIDIDNAPGTFTRGKTPIDFIIGTRKIKSAITAGGYLPFYAGAWQSDHRGLFIDVRIDKILGQVEESQSQITRTLQSNNKQMARKFLSTLIKTKKLETLHHRIETLYHQEKWVHKDKRKLETIDQEFTKLLIQAEKKGNKSKNTPWTSAIHQADLTYKYWKLYKKGKQNRIETAGQLTELQIKMATKEQIWQGNQNRPPKNQYLRAKKELEKLRKTSKEDRYKFLIAQRTGKINLKDNKAAKIISSIIKSERKRQGFRIQKALTKPQSEAGGLSHILITDDTKVTRIENKTEMHTLLYNRNITHFSQAKNTPCVNGKMADILEHNGVTETSRAILDRVPTNNIPESMQEICKELERTRLPQSKHMPFKDMINGLKNWRESTTTSPSGKHLGIYKTLVKAMNKEYHHTNPTENEAKENCQQQKIAEIALSIQHKLINLAIRYTHTFQRWKRIDNFFIEKIPGNPRIEKLRVIHIYEADWNLLLKYFICYKVHGAACKAQTVQPEQTGGRPGKSSAHTAAITTITSETILLQKLTGATIYNDAKACFDRIIENISNVTLMREGLHHKIATLHAQTLKHAQYFIKTKHGTHNQPNGHMQPEPFLGTGQGAADSMPRWSLLSDLLIRLYNANAISDPITCPISKMEIITKIRAFVDDTNSLSLCKNAEDLEHLLTTNATIWEQLLHIVGGKLELSKCKFTTYKWEANAIGTMEINEEKTIGALQIHDSETKLTNNVEEIEPSESYKLLGVEMATLRANKEQENMLIQKCNKMKKLLTMTNLPPAETWTSYKSIILPTLKYGNEATVIPEETLNRIQQTLTQALIPRLGLNRHTPRPLIYATHQMGGVGIQKLNTEQGIAHIALLTGSIRCNDETTKSIIALLESFIVTSGIIGNPMTNTQPTPYIISPWMDTTRRFMHQYQITIEIPQLQTIQPLRQRDRGIMEMAMAYTTNKHKLIAINNCRLYLQVHTLAEITTTDGREIIKSAYTGTTDLYNKPSFHKITQSKIIWPIQQRPPPTAWRIWQKWLRTKMKNKCLTLQHKLSVWNNHKHQFRQWTETQNQNDKTKDEKKENEMIVKRWRKATEKKILQADNTHIVIAGKQSRSKCVYSWEIHSNQYLIANHKGQATCHEHQSKMKSELMGLHEALYRITTIHQHWNTIPIPNKLTIWTKEIKMHKWITKARYIQPTIYNAMDDEAELKIAIIRLLEQHPGYRVRYPNENNEISTKMLEAITKQQSELEEYILTRTQSNKLRKRAEIKIKGEPITANTHNNLRYAAEEPLYHKYLEKKYNWREQTIELIDWKTLRKATNNLPPSLRKTVQQVTHGWLPTNGHPGANSPTTQICPRCNQDNETNLHFLACPIGLNEWADALGAKLQRKNEPPIHDTLINTIKLVITNQTITLADEYKHIEADQIQIGWMQMLFGRWTHRWSNVYNQQSDTEKGNEWAAGIIRCIWRHIKERWKTRCELDHGENPAKTANQETDTNNNIQNIYNQQHQLLAIDRTIFKRTLSEMKRLTITEKASWIKRNKQTLAHAKTRARHHLNRTNKQITTYFGKTASPKETTTKKATITSTNRDTTCNITPQQENRYRTTSKGHNHTSDKQFKPSTETPQLVLIIPTSTTAEAPPNTTSTKRTNPVQVPVAKPKAILAPENESTSTYTCKCVEKTSTDTPMYASNNEGTPCTRSVAELIQVRVQPQENERNTTDSVPTQVQVRKSPPNTEKNNYLTPKRKSTPRTRSLRRFRRNPKTQKENLDPP